MPLYDFQCKKCHKNYDEFVSFSKISSVKCPYCKSKSKTKLISSFNMGFTSSKMDNFGYRAGYNMENAKAVRRNAEEHSHVGPNPYGE